MKYVLLIYGNPENWEPPVFRSDPRFLARPAGERAALAEQAEALRRELTESGELIEGVALAGPGRARTIRVREGVTVATDGPYIEAKEQLAGYLLVDCVSPERAAEIAARIPDARFGLVEVHPVAGEPTRPGSPATA
ncbi:MAG: YciI family protein [Streptosporangiaceae bacterium]